MSSCRGWEGAPAAPASTPLRVEATASKGEAVEYPAHPQRPRDRLACDEARGSPSVGGSLGSQQATPQIVGEPLVNIHVSSANFLTADTSAKCALVEKLAKSWSLAPAGPSAVDEEQVAIAEAV